MLRFFKSSVNIPLNRLDAPRSLFLSLEGGAPFEQDIERLHTIKADGISSVSLTWNGDNTLAGGALGFGGLTEKGVSAIRLINRLSLALDISHLNEKSALKAVELSDTPLASHSNARVVKDHPRNLSDDILKMIKDKSGLVGINFYPPFVGGADIFDGVFRHIYHLLSLGLEENIALGSDFDGGDMDDKLKNTEDVFNLYDCLLGRLGDKILLDKMFFGNAYTFYQKLFDKQDIVL